MARVDFFDALVGGNKIKSSNSTSLHSRSKAYKETYKQTRDHRSAVASYVAGNK